MVLYLLLAEAEAEAEMRRKDERPIEQHSSLWTLIRHPFVRDVVPLMVPAAALATRNDAPRVAVLDDQQKVRYRMIKLRRDYGAEIEVIGGLNAVHPGDDLPEGTSVDPIPLSQ